LPNVPKQLQVVAVGLVEQPVRPGGQVVLLLHEDLLHDLADVAAHVDGDVHADGPRLRLDGERPRGADRVVAGEQADAAVPAVGLGLFHQPSTSRRARSGSCSGPSTPGSHGKLANGADVHRRETRSCATRQGATALKACGPLHGSGVVRWLA
jgi:hypothetical protein